MKQISDELQIRSGKVDTIDVTPYAKIVYVDEQIESLSGKVIEDELVTANALESIQDGTGLDDNLKYVAHSSDSILSGATSLDDADLTLANELETLINKVDAIDLTPYAKTTYVDGQIKTRNTSAGFDDDGKYVVNSTSPIISGATDLTNAINLLSAYIVSLEERVAQLESGGTKTTYSMNVTDDGILKVTKNGEAGATVTDDGTLKF